MGGVNEDEDDDELDAMVDDFIAQNLEVEAFDEDEEEVKSENGGLGKFSGLSIKKNSIPEETGRKKDEVKESMKNSEERYEWQNMEAAAAAAKNNQEVKIEGSPVFRSAPIPTITGLPPGLKVEIKEIQGKRWNIFTQFFV